MSNKKNSNQSQPATLFVFEISGTDQTEQAKFEELQKQYALLLERQRRQREDSERRVAAVYG